MKTVTLELPDFWATALFYDDTSGFEYEDEKREKHEKEFIGLPSRIFQHEYDHMEGTDFTHKVSRLKIERAMKKFNKTVKRLRNNPN